MAPLEKALTETFLPALLQEESISPQLRQRLALPLKQGGIGIPNPVTTADSRYSDSVACTRKLTESLLETKPAPFDVRGYQSDCKRQCRAASKSRVEAAKSTIDALAAELADANKLRFIRSVDKAKKTGNWLTIAPDFQNGTDLTANEFRDSLRLWYDLPTPQTPQKM